MMSSCDFIVLDDVIQRMAKHGLHRLLRHPAPLLCSDSRRRLYTKAVDKAALGRGDTGVATQAFSQDPRAGALQMSGGRMTSTDNMEGMGIWSQTDITLESKNMMVTGGMVDIHSDEDTVISSHSIELSSGWNQQISMDANGGFVTLGAVKMTGSRVSSDDAMHGIAMRSKEDVEIAAADDSDVMRISKSAV